MQTTKPNLEGKTEFIMDFHGVVSYVRNDFEDLYLPHFIRQGYKFDVKKQEHYIILGLLWV